MSYGKRILTMNSHSLCDICMFSRCFCFILESGMQNWFHQCISCRCFTRSGKDSKLNYLHSHLATRSVSPLVSWSTSQSVSQPFSQSASQLFNQSVSQPLSQSANHLLSQSAAHLFSQPVSSSVSQSVSQSASQSVSQSVSLQISWSLNQSVIFLHVLTVGQSVSQLASQ